MNEQEITAPEIAPEAEEQTEAMPAEASAESAAEASAGTEAGTGPDAEALTVEELGLSERAAGTETEDTRLKAIIEAAIYITEEPLLPKQMAEALAQPIERIEAILSALVAEYALPERGLSIRELAGGYKMGTKAEHHDELRGFVKKLKPQLKLSLAALETLAMIAYKQPITSPEIMEIRGVQGAGVLKTLLDRKLITAAGRKAVVGKPVLYKTTKEFLIQFGLKDLSELPTLKEFEELSRLALGDEPEAGQPEAAQPEAAPAEASQPETSEPETSEPPAGPGTAA
ncbi:MAG: SMC-Scp complex subunit ScpB [Bryobacterales bacterium]|nr:SMC-Scp complex subunit ScpB [Bryobacterales bacterium]